MINERELIERYKSNKSELNQLFNAAESSESDRQRFLDKVHTLFPNRDVEGIFYDPQYELFVKMFPEIIRGLQKPQSQQAEEMRQEEIFCLPGAWVPKVGEWGNRRLSVFAGRRLFDLTLPESFLTLVVHEYQHCIDSVRGIKINGRKLQKDAPIHFSSYGPTPSSSPRIALVEGSAKIAELRFLKQDRDFISDEKLYDFLHEIIESLRTYYQDITGPYNCYCDTTRERNILRNLRSFIGSELESFVSDPQWRDYRKRCGLSG
jgi:hypothetical protein